MFPCNWDLFVRLLLPLDESGGSFPRIRWLITLLPHVRKSCSLSSLRVCFTFFFQLFLPLTFDWQWEWKILWFGFLCLYFLSIPIGLKWDCGWKTLSYLAPVTYCERGLELVFDSGLASQSCCFYTSCHRLQGPEAQAGSEVSPVANQWLFWVRHSV